MYVDPTDEEYKHLIDLLENVEHLLGYVLKNEKVQYDTKYDLDSAFDSLEDAIAMLRDAEAQVETLERADEKNEDPPSDLEALAEDLA